MNQAGGTQPPLHPPFPMEMQAWLVRGTGCEACTHGCIASGLVKNGRVCVDKWAFKCVHAHALARCVHHAAQLAVVRHAYVRAQRFGYHL
eukprot:1152925-Pelagomonas_calceolata.AAC.4